MRLSSPPLKRSERPKLAIGIDPFGRVHYGKDNVGGDYAVAVLGEQVSDAHLAELRMDGVSYIFWPKDCREAFCGK
jgi:hypothetical protein